MAAVAREIDSLAGAQVQQVHQPEEETVVLTLRLRGRNRRLLLSAHARHGRAHLLADRPPSRAARDERPECPTDEGISPARRSITAPPPFTMLLRKHLKGSFLAGARQIGFDRVLHLTFRFGETETRLVLEVMGKHSNLMLVNAGGTLLDAIKRVSARESRVRPVHPGIPYTPPPTGGKRDPAEATAEMIAAFVREDPEAVLADLLRDEFPLGPTALAAVLARCHVDAETPAGGVAPGVVASALRAVADPTTYVPALLCDARGVPAGAAFLPETEPPPGGERQPAESASEALEDYYTYRIAHEAVEARRRAFLRAVADTSRYAERRIREAEEGIEAARKAPDLEREATLLLSNLGRIARGAEQVTVVDFYDPEQKEVTLTLDPTLPAREQVEKRFKRARKLVDAVPHLERQWEEEQERVSALQAIRPLLEAARSREELDALAPELRALGVLRETPAPATRERASAASGVQHRPIGGYEVLLGRNATENDHLTRHIAEPEDLWLHARGVTSAHVVIRTGKHPERVPPEVIREAAKLCALHSASKHSALVPVDYTLRKYVVKRRGSAPGTVQYTHEKTLHVEPGL
ncbi:MAG TPA: fibronectin/fibrinogen-binding protein [Armatimonadetes bacterium]|nr:fibronectin/fibrinogen-binding protein [Armatimonadota bacterium]